MPVTDGVFVPRSELVLAETVVDFLGMHNHVLEQRLLVEQQALAQTRRLAQSAVTFRIPSIEDVVLLEQTLEQALRRTVRFGYRGARAELARLREADPVEAREITDAGRYAREAEAGLAGILRLIRRRAAQVAERVSTAALAAAGIAAEGDQEDDTLRLAAVLDAARRKLHNGVLELVGETLNLGRTAGVLELDRPPEFAMRSEQLDKGTCGPCNTLHGAIVEVGSAAYFDYMPPSGCLGGGRCRGIYVHGDGPSQMRLPDTPPGPQPELPPIPPVQFPRRRAA